MLHVDLETTVKILLSLFHGSGCAPEFCLEFCRGIKNKNKTKQHIEALAVKSAMALSFNWFYCSIARTKPYKKHHKKDHVALYQYVISEPGPQKTK